MMDSPAEPVVWMMFVLLEDGGFEEFPSRVIAITAMRL